MTGGASRRLGQDKATAAVGGARLIDAILADLPAEVPVVIVGPDPQAARPVIVTREDPPGGGPAAAIAAGLRHVRTPFVAVLAADMPFAVPALRGLGQPDRDAVVPRAGGHPQPLCARYRTTALRGASPVAGMSMKALLERLRVDYVDRPAAAFLDIDTPEDLQAARQRLIMSSMVRWIEAVKQELDIDAEVDVARILDVAKDAAHAVERPAAPVTTYLLGLAVAKGADPATAAEAIARLAQSWAADA